MPNMTLAISNELHRQMRSRTDIRWSDVARKAFEKRLTELALLDQMLRKSELTEKDAEKIGHSIKRKIRTRFA